MGVSIADAVGGRTRGAGRMCVDAALPGAAGLPVGEATSQCVGTPRPPREGDHGGEDGPEARHGDAARTWLLVACGAGLGAGFPQLCRAGFASCWFDRRWVVGAAGAGVADVAACSVKACAKSLQRGNRSLGFLARAAATTGSNAASSDRVSASAGGSVLRWRLMTTAGLECVNKGVPVNRLVGGGGQRVLVGAAVDVLPHQLLGRRVGDGSDGHVGGGQTADVVDGLGDAEVGQQDSPLCVIVDVGEHDFGGLDVAV